MWLSSFALSVSSFVKYILISMSRVPLLEAFQILLKTIIIHIHKNTILNVKVYEKTFFSRLCRHQFNWVQVHVAHLTQKEVTKEDYLVKLDDADTSTRGDLFVGDP